MRFINLTPHGITVRTDGGDVDIPASGQVARVAEQATDAGMLDGIPVVDCRLAEVTGLPPAMDGTIYIVSPMVSGAVDGRPDVVAPDTGPASVVRDDAGRIVAVRRFRRMM
jgi:hypothetical protein